MSTKICCTVSYQIKFSLWNKTKHVFLNNDQENKMIYEIPRPTIHISDNFNDQSFSTPINSFVQKKKIPTPCGFADTTFSHPSVYFFFFKDQRKYIRIYLFVRYRLKLRPGFLLLRKSYVSYLSFILIQLMRFDNLEGQRSSILMTGWRA